MLKKKRQQTDDGQPAVPDGPKFPIDQILDGPRPGPSDAEADRAWRAARHALFQAEHCHPRFDPRKLTALPRKQAAIWREARRVWALEVLADFVSEMED